MKTKNHLVAVLCVALCACVDQPAGVTTLLYASPYGPAHPFSRADKTWMAWVEKQSRGRIRIRAIWSGALISAEQSMLEIRHGLADIGLITPIYAKGGTHLIRTQSGFYGGAKRFEDQVALYRCLAHRFPQYARELHGLKVLAVQGGSLPGIITRERPVRTLDDLDGMRIRAPTELLDVLDALGADPVDMAMSEVYSALAKGVIDGVIAPADTFKSLHFAEVAHHYTRLDVPRGAYPARAMSLERWRSLPPEAQDLLEASGRIWEAALAEEINASVAAGVARARAEGVIFHAIDAAAQQRFDTLYARAAQRNARALGRYGIAGERIFHAARRIAAGIEQTGRVVCKDHDHGPAP